MNSKLMMMMLMMATLPCLAQADDLAIFNALNTQFLPYPGPQGYLVGVKVAGRLACHYSKVQATGVESASCTLADPATMGGETGSSASN
jgi:hypothetical protein